MRLAFSMISTAIHVPTALWGGGVAGLILTLYIIMMLIINPQAVRVYARVLVPPNLYIHTYTYIHTSTSKHKHRQQIADVYNIYLYNYNTL